MSERFSGIIIRFLGILIAALGLVVLAGWYTGNIQLVQVHPTLVPMQYNTALGFLLSGIGLFALINGRFRIATLVAVMLVLLSVATLLQYIFTIDFGIDELFMHAYITVKTSHPGRMAPNTALNFMLTGIALLFMTTLARSVKNYHFVIGLFTSVISGLSLISLFGYLAGISTTYGWGHYTHMALHTSVGFILVGICFGTFTWRGISAHIDRQRRWLLIPTWLILALSTLILWQALDTREARHLEERIHSKALNINHDISTQIKLRMLAIDRMARRWETHEGTHHKHWELDAKHYLQDMPGIQAIEWANSETRVRWVMPLQGNEAILGLDLESEQHRRKALKAALSSRATTISHSIDLVQGGRGFLILAPIFIKGNFDGFIVGVLRIDHLFDAIIRSETKNNYHIALLEDGHVIYQSSSPATILNERLNNTIPLETEATDWWLQIIPQSSALAEFESALPLVTLISGLVMATLFTFMINFLQDSRHHARTLERTNKILQKEILDRQAAELQLGRFKTTLDLTKDCVFMLNPDTLKFFYVNQGAMEEVGYSDEELMNMTPMDITPEINDKSFRKQLKPMLEGKQDSMTFETTLRHKDGSLIPVEVFLQHIAPTGEPARFVAIVRDISERKKVERLKNEFISTVSHELRTPLTSIRGSIGLLIGGASGELPEKTTDLLKIASNNTERLLLLINDILDIQKIESGNMAFNFKPVELMPFLEQAIDENTAYAAQHDVNFRITARVEGATVFADEDRLMQVMSNLLSNAAKFSPAGGTIEIAVARLGKSVRVSVTDHGPGVPEDFHDNIFERFTQSDSSDTRDASGSGLGLNITQAIVKQLGGSIDFVSRPGISTTFYFDLPEIQV